MGDAKTKPKFRPAILPANEKALRARAAELPSWLAGVDGNRPIVLKPARSGAVCGCVGANGSGVSLCSRYDPEAEAVQIASTVDDGARDVLLFGFGLGHLPRAVLSRLPEDGRLYAVICNPDVFRDALAAAELSDVLSDPRFHLIAGNESTVIERLRLVLDDGAAKAVLIDKASHRVCQQVAPRLFDLVDTVRESRELAGPAMREIQRNYVANLPYLIEGPGIRDLGDRFRGVPCVIVSAGPSLDQNKHVLPQVAHHALVLCVDRAYPACRSVGVRPHFVVSVDSFDSNRRNFEKITDPVPLIYMPSIHPGALRSHEGPKIAALPRDDRMAAFVDERLGLGSVASGGSVTNAAAGIAHYLGCDPIVFVGLDLCYPTGRAHAKDAWSGRTVDIRRHPRRVEVPAHDGGTYYTLPNFLRYLRWLERFVETHCETTFVDATEGGVFKRGLQVATLAGFARSVAFRDVPPVEIPSTRSTVDSSATQRFKEELLCAFPEAVSFVREETGPAGAYSVPSRY